MLKKLLATALILSVSGLSYAGEDEGKGKGKRGQAGNRAGAGGASGQAGRRGRPGDAAKGGNAQDGNQRRGAMMGGDPNVIAGRMMQAFDKDGDQQLSKVELVALITSMQQRNPQMRGQAGRGGDMQDRMRGRRGGQNPGGNGRGRGGNQEAKVGGDIPQRPGKKSGGDRSDA
ncbi:MAG TPA: hypothetical protein DDW52_00610 [Planctomycetaceae bacterium]|nr:hypothetical protein [Planctomycetaceae bacterium]